MPKTAKQQTARQSGSSPETSSMAGHHSGSATVNNMVSRRQLSKTLDHFPESLGFNLPEDCAANCINCPPSRLLDPEVFEDDLTRELKANVAAIQLRSLKVQARVNSLTDPDLSYRSIYSRDDAYRPPKVDSPPQVYKALFPQRPQKVNYTKPPPPPSKSLSMSESIQPYKSIFRRSPSPLRHEAPPSLSPSRPVRTLAQPTSAVDVAFEQLMRKPLPDNEPSEREDLALKMYCRTRNTEVLKYLQELSTDFTPNQVKRIYQILWEFEHHTVKDYYLTVESGVLFIRGETGRFRNPKVNYYDPSPSQDLSTTATDFDEEEQSTNNLPDLLQILDVFKSFEAYPPPRHLPINAKMLQDCHNLSEQRLNPIKEPPISSHHHLQPQQSAAGSSMTPNASPLTTPKLLNSQPVAIALKSLDDVLADFQPGMTVEKKKTSATGGSKKIRKRKEVAGDEVVALVEGTTDTNTTNTLPRTPKKARTAGRPSGIIKPPAKKRAKRTATMPLPASSSASSLSEWMIPQVAEPATASTTPMLMPMDPTALLYRMAFQPMIPVGEGEASYQEILDLFGQLSQDNQLAMLHTFTAGGSGNVSVGGSELGVPGFGSLAMSPLSVTDIGNGLGAMLGGGDVNSFRMDQLDWSFESSIGSNLTSATDGGEFAAATGEKEDEALREYMNTFELDGSFGF
ncbi:UNVERIFIED_CONTAM: hypothetical protein HDU68_008769 [Siphonaria sp. JEL0065]|nr:hypothetical protein HDU68_008769 [Siphonaria sp. JEL0065]